MITVSHGGVQPNDYSITKGGPAKGYDITKGWSGK